MCFSKYIPSSLGGVSKKYSQDYSWIKCDSIKLPSFQWGSLVWLLVIVHSLCWSFCQTVSSSPLILSCGKKKTKPQCRKHHCLAVLRLVESMLRSLDSWRFLYTDGSILNHWINRDWYKQLPWSEWKFIAVDKIVRGILSSFGSVCCWKHELCHKYNDSTVLWPQVYKRNECDIILFGTISLSHTVSFRIWYAHFTLLVKWLQPLRLQTYIQEHFIQILRKVPVETS